MGLFMDWKLQTAKVKVNKSVYMAKSRQRYHKTHNNILLHVSNHALKIKFLLLIIRVKLLFVLFNPYKMHY